MAQAATTETTLRFFFSSAIAAFTGNVSSLKVLVRISRAAPADWQKDMRDGCFFLSFLLVIVEVFVGMVAEVDVVEHLMVIVVAELVVVAMLVVEVVGMNEVIRFCSLWVNDRKAHPQGSLSVFVPF